MKATFLGGSLQPLSCRCEKLTLQEGTYQGEVGRRVVLRTAH